MTKAALNSKVVIRMLIFHYKISDEIVIFCQSILLITRTPLLFFGQGCNYILHLRFEITNMTFIA